MIYLIIFLWVLGVSTMYLTMILTRLHNLEKYEISEQPKAIDINDVYEIVRRIERHLND